MAQRGNPGFMTVLQISDLHLHASTDSRMRGVRTDATFMSVVEHALSVESWYPDVVLVTGDIVQDESRAGYERFMSIVSRFACPVICIPGNHDDPTLMASLLRAPPFQLCGEARYRSWSVIALSTFLIGEDAGGLGNARLASLDRALREHRNRHVLICMHHHPLPVGSRWLDGVGLRDSEEFLEIVTSHSNVRAVVCGHVHQQAHRIHKNIEFLACPSTCAQFLPGSEYFALDSLPPGMRWLRLYDDGRFESEVHWATAESRQ